MTRLGKILPQQMLLDNAVFAVDGTHPPLTPVQKMPMGAVVTLYVDELLAVQPLVAVAAGEPSRRDAVLVGTLVAAVVVMATVMAMVMATAMAMVMAMEMGMETGVTRETEEVLDMQGSRAIAPKEAAA
jgi:hypothetical protein